MHFPAAPFLSFLAALLSLVLVQPARGENAMSLAGSGRVFVDTTGTLGFEEVLHRRDELFRSDMETLRGYRTFSPTDRIWLALPLPDMDELLRKGWRGTFGLAIKDPHLAQVTAFFTRPNGVLTRNWEWADERRLAGNGYRHPFLGFEPAQVEGGLLLLRVTTRMPFDGMVWLSDFQSFFGNYNVETTLLSVLIGVKAAIFLYILALGLSLRSATNLWLAGCIMCGLVYVVCQSGFLETQLLPGQAALSQSLLLAARVVIQAAILMFAMNFLRQLRVGGPITGAAKLASALYLALGLAGLADLDFALLVRPFVIPVLGGSTVVLLVALSSNALVSRRKRVVFFLAAWALALLPIALSSLLVATPAFGPSPITRDPVFLGISLSLVLFTIYAAFDVRHRETMLRRQILHNVDRFRGFAAIGTDSFWEVDNNGRLTFLSGRRSGATDLRLGDVLVDRLEASSSADYMRPIRETVGGLLPFDDRRIRVSHEDKDVWLSLSGRAITAPGQLRDDPGVYRGIIRDVTEETERETRRTMEQQMLALGQLVGSVAHEVNNLIHPIINLTKRLRKRLEEHGDNESERLMELIDLSSRQAAKVVSELLRSTRDQRWKDIDRPLSLAVEYSVEAVRPAIPASVKIDVVTEEIARPTVKIGDVLQIVGNLVSNAVHAMDGRGQISVTLSSSAEGARLTVSDDGAGMEESVRRRAMQPFFTTKTDGRGTGVGLYVVQRIVRDYGGWITIDSVPGMGTTFTILFPERKEDDGNGAGEANGAGGR